MKLIVYKKYTSSTGKWSSPITIDELLSVNFGHDIDPTGLTVPIPQFEVEIKKNDDIKIGYLAVLCDQTNYPYSQCFITKIETVELGVVRILAQSPFCLTSTKNLPAIYYSNEAIDDVINDTLGDIDRDYWLRILGNVSGYFPEQTARERLQQLFLVFGMFITCQYLDADIEFCGFEDGSDPNGSIEVEQIFYFPLTLEKTYVSKITVRAYSYVAGTPAPGEEYVTANGTTYIETYNDYSLSDPNVPEYARAEEISITGVRIINEGNYNSILNRLAQYYFARTDMEVEAIVPVVGRNSEDPWTVSTGPWCVGEMINFYSDMETEVRGLVKSADYKFGHIQNRVKLSIAVMESFGLKKLTINAIWNGTKIGTRKIEFAPGYYYEVTNPYIAKTIGNYKYVFRPLTPTTYGTMPNKNKTVRVEYEAVLVQNVSTTLLTIFGVDDYEVTDGRINIE